MEPQAGNDHRALPLLHIPNVQIPTPSQLLHLDYTPLDETKDEIRLLYLLPQDKDSQSIHCTLTHFSLHSRPSPFQSTYTALSYCWGSQSEPHTIFINGTNVLITENLYLGLQELRNRGYTTVWVDALCINQTDEVERGQQVLRMKTIYSNANVTLAWLGPDPHRIAKCAFEHVNNLTVNDSRFKTEGPRVEPASQHDTPGWAATTALLALPYWHRTWIIQELSVSNSVLLLWGSEVVPLSHLIKTLLALRQKTKIRALTSDYLHVSGVVKIIVSTRRDKENPRSRLMELLHLSCKSQASEQRDKIFGILGLSKDGPKIIPAPSYGDSLEGIVEDMTRKMFLNTYGKSGEISTLIFKAPIAITYTDDRQHWPSWVIDWPTFWQSQDGYLWTSKSNRGLRFRFHATGTSTSDVRFSDNGKVLRISGYILDTIFSISNVRHHGKAFNSNPTYKANEAEILEPHRLDHSLTKKSRREISHNIYGSEADLYEAIWRSLIMDQTANISETAPAIYGQHFGRVWAENHPASGSVHGDFEIYGRSLNAWAAQYSDLVPTEQAKTLSTHGEEENIPKMLEDLLYNVNLSSTFSRRAMETEKGYVGLTHALSEVGDRICLLNGCLVPVVLRAYKGSFAVIGEAYVHGIMNGEAWKVRDLDWMRELCII